MGDRLQLLQIAKSKLQSLSIDEAKNTQYNSKYANLIKTTLQKKKNVGYIGPQHSWDKAHSIKKIPHPLLFLSLQWSDESQAHSNLERHSL